MPSEEMDDVVELDFAFNCPYKSKKFRTKWGKKGESFPFSLSVYYFPVHACVGWLYSFHAD